MIPHSCLSPVTFRRNGEFVAVPCGHCDACAQSKGLNLRNRLDFSFYSYKYRYFITLTYEDSQLPVARFNEFSESFVSDKDFDYNGVCYSCPVSSIDWKDLSFVSDCVEKYGGLPYVSRKDSINFKKRLRKYVKSSLGFSPKIFIYIVGEYGFKKHRPHLHALIGFNEPKLSVLFEQCVYSAWRYRDTNTQKRLFRPIGRVDIKGNVSGGASDYLTKYLTVGSYQPSFYKRSAFQPFYQSSRMSEYIINSDLPKTFQEFYARSPFELCAKSPKTGNYVNFSVQSSYASSRFVRRCYKFEHFSLCELAALYGIYGRCPTEVRGFIEYFRSLASRGRFYFLTLGEQLVLKYFIHNDFSDEIRLKRLYYLSRGVLAFLSGTSISILQYCRFLLDYWSKVALNRLKTFYEEYENMLHCPFPRFTLEDSFALYSLTDPKIANFAYYQKCFNQKTSPLDIQDNITLNYHVRMRIFAQNSCKTHRRNDFFASKNLKRKQWMPMRGINLLSKLQKI